MTDRIPLDDLTSDQLDALYDERDAARDRLDHHERTMLPNLHRRIESDAETIQRWRGRAESAELRTTQARAALDRALSPTAIRAAAEAIGDTALTHLGRDIGTIHADHIAEAGLRAALDQAQQPTTGSPFGDRHGPTPDEVREGLASLFTNIGPPVACPHCGPDAAPVPATHWTKHLLRHHCECGGTTPHPECSVHTKQQPTT